MRSLGRVLGTIGWVLIAAYAVARIHALLGSNVALAQLASTRSAEDTVPAVDDAPVDVSLWSSQRIAAFKEALGIPSPPPIAALRVPRIGIEVPVFKGTDDVTLNRGAGWIPGTALPGTSGNVAISAHRDGFFRPLKDVSAGDLVELESYGQVQTYVVRSISIVDPKDVSSLEPTNDPALTLVTCYPFYFVGSAPQRFIVRATPADVTAGGPGGITPKQSTTGPSASRTSE